MNLLQQNKTVIAVAPTALVKNASVTSATIDTLGFNEAEFCVVYGTTDVATTVLKVEESDAANMSGATDVTGLIWGTSINPDTGTTATLPTSSDGSKLWKAFLALNGRKRYLRVVVTLANGTNGAYVAGICNLTKGNDTPTSATERGAASNLIV